jgi:hypothetical protein
MRTEQLDRLDIKVLHSVPSWAVIPMGSALLEWWTASRGNV